MKMFIIFWLCIQNPYTSLDTTCTQQIIYNQSYNTKAECRAASESLAQSFMQEPNVLCNYICTTKAVPKA